MFQDFSLHSAAAAAASPLKKRKSHLGQYVHIAAGQHHWSQSALDR